MLSNKRHPFIASPFPADPGCATCALPIANWRHQPEENTVPDDQVLNVVLNGIGAIADTYGGTLDGRTKNEGAVTQRLTIQGRQVLVTVEVVDGR